MQEKKLREILSKLEKETEEMTDFERETYYRFHLMPHFSVGVIENEKT